MRPPQHGTSVVSGVVHGSYWPSLLRTDTSLHRAVPKRFFLLGMAATAGALLNIVAGITTPLGLVDIVKSGDDETVSFTYLRDDGPVGLGTPRRDVYNYTRLCGTISPRNCPGVDDGYQTWDVYVGPYRHYNTTFDQNIHTINTGIPHNITEVFSSGTVNTSVSSLFDIQYRAYSQYSSTYSRRNYPALNGSLYTAGKFQPLQLHILNEGIELIEGLIVDTKNGGVGFRNHTIPPPTDVGAEWEEEMLWMEPVTECVDTNLTVEFEYHSYSTLAREIYLVDNGGFVNLGEDPPFDDSADLQEDPQLRATAHRTAWFHSMQPAVYFNLTTTDNTYNGKSELGKRYNITPSSPRDEFRAYQPGNQRIEIGSPITELLESAAYTKFTYRVPNERGHVSQFKMTKAVDMSSVDVYSGIMLGAPTLKDGDDSTFKPLTNWTQKVISCASAARASIKVVSFSMDGRLQGSGSLQDGSQPNTRLRDVRVVKISDKEYANDESKPLWAIEKSNLSASNYSPMWGIVDSKYQDSPSIYTRRKEHLWLPPGQQKGGLFRFLGTIDSNPASAHSASLLEAYSGIIEKSSGEWDYSGKTYGLFVRWQKLSASDKTAGSIINLIWTDLMANLVVGTNPGPWSASRRTASIRSLITPKKKRVAYDFRFAIPAIILVALWVAVLCPTIVLSFRARVSLPALRQLANKLSPGRMATNLLASETCSFDAPTREWARKAGILPVGFQWARSQRDGATPYDGERESMKKGKDKRYTMQITVNPLSRYDRKDSIPLNSTFTSPPVKKGMRDRKGLDQEDLLRAGKWRRPMVSGDSDTTLVHPSEYDNNRV
ncbi:hypothetical protein FQN49_001483 [Arthroderma sp. PD_2]|nr:hypothetical protein FQN49_001483 [Arthroderma sp. PD_2]